MSDLREQKRAATRAALGRAAASIVLTEGIDGLTVVAVAAEAGVSTRTFHNYFSSREEALAAYVRGQMHTFVGQLWQIEPGTSFLDGVEQVLLASLDESTDELDSALSFFRVNQLLTSLRPAEGDEGLHDLLKTAPALLGERFPDFDPFEFRLTIEAASAVARTAVRHHIESGGSPADREGVAAAVARAFAVLRAC